MMLHASVAALLLLVILVAGAIAVLLTVDLLRNRRKGEGLSILDDRPGTDDQFGEWNREDS